MAIYFLRTSQCRSRITPHPSQRVDGLRVSLCEAVAVLDICLENLAASLKDQPPHSPFNLTSLEIPFNVSRGKGIYLPSLVARTLPVHTAWPQGQRGHVLRAQPFSPPHIL